MCQDYADFSARAAEIVAIGPDSPADFLRYWDENQIPFIGCADLNSRVAGRYSQEVNWLKFGRMPALFIVDRSGRVRYVHYASSMSDIPSNRSVLDALDRLLQEDDDAAPPGK